MKIPVKKIVYKSKNVLVERSLRYRGEIIVTKGSEVNLFDVLGRGYKLENFIEVPAGYTKGLEVGDRVRKGQVLKKGFLPKFIGRNKDVKVDFDGQVYKKNKELAVVGSFPSEHQLVSGVKGTVRDVVAGKTVLIKAEGLVIEGVTGWGEGVFGDLKMVVKKGQLGGYYKDKIVVFTDKVDQALAEDIVETKPGGVVLGGISSAIFDYLVDNGVPVILLKGFGDIPIDTHVVLTLSQLQNRFVYLRAGVGQLFISQPVEKENAVEDFIKIEEGMLVQLMSHKYFGYNARVVKILKEGKVEVDVMDEDEVMEIMFYELVYPYYGGMS